jgi:type IV fimbrial biogenesis protein FimT
VLNRLARRAGFTIVEMLVALAIAAFLLVLSMPMYTVWLADSQIHGGAEAVAAGLRQAQAEAIRRNEPVQLVFDRTTKTGGWRAELVSDGSTLQSGLFLEGADRATFAPTPAGNTTVTFSGLGVIVAANADGSAPFASVDVSIPAVAGSRALRVLVGDPGIPAGSARIKICDPAWPATDPKGCP